MLLLNMNGAYLRFVIPVKNLHLLFLRSNVAHRCLFTGTVFSFFQVVAVSSHLPHFFPYLPRRNQSTMERKFNKCVTDRAVGFPYPIHTIPNAQPILYLKSLSTHFSFIRTGKFMDASLRWRPPLIRKQKQKLLHLGVPWNTASVEHLCFG